MLNEPGSYAPMASGALTSISRQKLLDLNEETNKSYRPEDKKSKVSFCANQGYS